MEASPKAVKDILTGDKRYFIPPYQRPYRWDADNVEQLVDDIWNSLDAEEKEYFIGSIICIRKGNDKYEVVDGQQRLITLTLILSALARRIEGTKLKVRLEGMVLQNNLYDEDSASIPSLVVQEKVRSCFLHIIGNGKNKDAKKLSPNQKVFLNNYNKINNLLSGKTEEELKNFAKHLLESIKIIFVEVDDMVSSFRLFNVLNNRGMPLSDADLVKNLLLSEANDEEAGYDSKEVENRWSEIEDVVGEDNVDRFLTLHQISEKKDRDRVKKGNFSYYEKELKGMRFRRNARKMSEALLLSAERSERYQSGECLGARKIVSFLKMLNFPSEWEPAFMAFLNKEHDEDKFHQFAKLFEKVYIHYLLSGDTSSRRESVCYYALEAINNNKSFDDILTIMRNLAQNKNLDAALDRNNFYDTSSRNTNNIVKSLLLRVQAEWYDDSANINYNLKKITIEHILPQNMSDADSYWRSRFTDEQHEEWCHRLGNLTLISRHKNTAARNHGFDKKKEAYQRLGQQSPFKITADLCNLPEWNMESLQKRHEQLKKNMKDLWEIPADLV